MSGDGVSPEGLQRIGVKLFCEAGADVALVEVIPIFHRWIQTARVPGLLVDVADYSHVPDGPGIVLVAHEGIYAVDETGGRRGVVYYRRAAMDGPLAARLVAIARTALAACDALAREPEVAGRLRLRGDEVLVFANDRLHAPNTEAARRALAPALDALVAKLYPGLACARAPETDPKERLAVTVTAPEPVAVETLLARLDA